MDSYALNFSLSNLGPKSYQKVLKKFGSPKNGWGGTREEFEEIGIKNLTFEKFESFRNNFDSAQYIGQLKKAGVGFVSFFDKNYPESLKNIDDPPIGLFCKGNLELLKKDVFKISVVGTRKMTSYGKAVTETIVRELCQNGICIVSGLALGVDGLSHRTAVSNNGKTIAVLGCGVDCCLPSENFSLYQDILNSGGLIVSEYPLSQPPNKGTFLARNRIVAALSQGVLVTEAAEDSGSLVTAGWGLKLGKKVFAVPGPINSPMMQGSLKLLKQGAKLVTSGIDILEEFKMQNSKVKIASQKFKSLNKEEKKIVTLLENEGMTIDEMSRKIDIKTNVLMGTISVLELRGILKNTAGKISIK